MMDDKEYAQYIAEGKTFKHSIFTAASSFLNHCNGCLVCLLAKSENNICDAQVCEVGKKILGWWHSWPEFVLQEHDLMKDGCLRCDAEERGELKRVSTTPTHYQED